MESILRFRPFRIVKGQVIVTSYLGWRKLVTNSNRGNKAELFADLDMVLYQHVVNHKGEKLYWFSEQGFIEHPVINYGFMISHRLYDVDGVPTFSYITEKDVKKSSYPHLFEPLSFVSGK